jgi:iron complex transport system substrate-binding protein
VKKILQLLLLTLLLGFLIGCSDGTDNTEETPVTDDAETEEVDTEETGSEEDSEEADYPLTLTDAVGNELTIEEEPERVVTLIPSNTEILFELGLGDKVVGVTDNDNYPEEVSEIDSVGSMEFNVEVIISLDPDVVLAHESGVSFAQEAFDQLYDAGVNVFVVEDATTIDTTYETIETVGQLMGATEEAERVISEMQDGFAEIEEITEEVAEEDRQSVFYEISPSPDIYTAGQNTFLDEILQVINADNAAGDQEGWPAIDPEAIIELNPDVIVTTYGSYIDNPVEEVTSRDGFEVVEAVANERVYDVDSDMVTRPGPRLVEGTRAVAEVVYPELFDEE